MKHGLAPCPHVWPWSSFQRWATAGYYDPKWLCTCNGPAVRPPDHGWADTFAME